MPDRTKNATKDAAIQRVRQLLYRALSEAEIPQLESSSLAPPIFGGTCVCWEEINGEIALVFKTTLLLGGKLQCAVSLEPIAGQVTGLLFDDSEAEHALADALQYLCGEIAEILPSLERHLAERRLSTIDRKTLRDLGKQHPTVKYAFEVEQEFFAQMRVAVESKRKESEKQLRAGRDRRGGSEPKHDWTSADLECLAAQYDDLQPIWLEAKRIAKDAQKSRERSRRAGWRAEVLRAYPYLPDDLLNRFANPRADDAKPSDIAILHAKRECGIAATYSARELREKIRAWKLKSSPRVSGQKPKSRKLKT